MVKLKNVIITTAIIALVGMGVAGSAVAGKGCGGGWRYQDDDWHHGAKQGYGGGYGKGMRPEEYQAVHKAREAFYNDTKDLRSKLFEKRHALRAELAKSEPDIGVASQLQREISDLQAALAQKRVTHMIEMRKINPDLGRGFRHGGPGMGFHMGYGKPGPGWGHGPHGFGGRGYCWQ